MLTMAALLCSAIEPATAQPPEQHFGKMSDGMLALAQHIRSALKAEGMNQVTIGRFEADVGAESSTFGPRIVTALKEQLESSQIRVTSTGGWSVSGRFHGELDSTSEKFEIFINSKLKDQRGKTQSELITPIITDEREALAMLGNTVSLPTTVAASDQGARQSLGLVRAQTIAFSRQQPAFSDGSVVKTGSSSPLAMEILVDGQPIAISQVDGRPFAGLGNDQRYEIRLINNSAGDVGVTLSIDGINTLAFSKNENYRRLGMWVIPARSSGTVRGWHVQGNEALAFVVTTLANAPAAQLGAVENIGTITASFCAAFEGDDLPPGEPVPTSRDQLATGKGPPIQQPMREVQRHFGVVRESISIRYAK
jgi:hypothetical protein